MENLSVFFKKHKYMLFLFIFILCGCLAVSLPYLLFDIPFSMGGDNQTQWFPFYEEFKNLIHAFIFNRELPFYSWVTFLGNNFWASKSFYGFFDIFNYLMLFFDMHYFSAYHIITIIKIFIAGFSFYFYARTVDIKQPAAVLVSVCYAFSSWIIFFISQSSFVSFYAIMPFYFAGMEKCIQKKQSCLFIFASALCLFTNYYYFYTISFFSPVYYLYRYYNYYGNFKNVVKESIKCIFIYLVGVLITGIMTIPTAKYIVSNDRVGSSSLSMFFDNPIIYLHQLISCFVPNHTYIYDPNIFETAEHISREICAWAGSITALVFPQFIFDRNKKFKKSTIILYVCFLLLLTPLGSSVIHGFSEYSFRWMILLIFMNLYMTGIYLSDLTKINFRGLRYTLIIEVCCIFICSLLGVLLNSQGFDLFYFKIQLLIFFIVSATLFFLYYILTKKIKNRFRILLFFTIIEVIIYACYSIHVVRFNKEVGWNLIDSVSSVLGSNQEINSYLKNLDEENDKQYYRVYVPVDTVYWDYSHNWNMHYGINGVSGYDSTYSPSFNKLRNIAWNATTYNDCGWQFDIKNSDLLSLLTTKYSITVSKEEIPFTNYEIVGDFYGLYVAENLNYRSLGVTYSKVMSYSEFKTEYNNDFSVLENILLADENDIDSIKKNMETTDVAFLKDIDYGGNTLSGYIETNGNSFMLISLPYDKGWNIVVNGENQKIYDVDGLIGVALCEGTNNIQMYFVPDGLKLGIVMTLIGTILFIVILGFKLRNYEVKRFEKNYSKK